MTRKLLLLEARYSRRVIPEVLAMAASNGCNLAAVARLLHSRAIALRAAQLALVRLRKNRRISYDHKRLMQDAASSIAGHRVFPCYYSRIGVPYGHFVARARQDKRHPATLYPPQ